MHLWKPEILNGANERSKTNDTQFRIESLRVEYLNCVNAIEFQPLGSAKHAEIGTAEIV